jgi:O-antigen/teichoic acid export membrane protein
VIPTGTILVAYDVGLVRLVLGERWSHVPPVLRPLVLSGVFRSLSMTVGPVAQGLGRPALYAVVAGFELVAVAVGLAALMDRGTPGVAAAMAWGALVQLTVALTLVRGLLGLRGRDLVHAIGVPVLGCAPIVALRVLLPGPPEGAGPLGAALVASGGLYLAALLVLARLGLFTVDPHVRARLGRFWPWPR